MLMRLEGDDRVCCMTDPNNDMEDLLAMYADREDDWDLQNILSFAVDDTQSSWRGEI